MNILVAGIPVSDKKAKKRIRLWVLDHLAKEYGIKEEDLVSAELEAVPAGPAKDVGFDRSFVGGYGQDDRLCSFCAIAAALDVKTPKYTTLIVLFDKEEIGSEGSTSGKSRFVHNFVGDLLALSDPKYPDSKLRGAFRNAKALSGDVNAAVNPSYKEVHELGNAAKISHGICITKYTGHGGKYGASDATAEFVNEVRRIFNKAGVKWQTAELGKIDEGGGGTVAKFLAEYDMDILDVGAPLLGMHSTFEVCSKADLYHLYKGYYAFLAS